VHSSYLQKLNKFGFHHQFCGVYCTLQQILPNAEVNGQAAVKEQYRKGTQTKLICFQATSQ
jgi:hypothetical protein